MQVSRWGNSLGVRLPDTIVEALELKEGDEIQITIGERHELQVSKDAERLVILASLREFRGRLPADFVFDRDEANGQ